MKKIKEKVLFDMKTRHPEYECRNHEIAIDLTIEKVLGLIDELAKDSEGDLLTQQFIKELKERING